MQSHWDRYKPQTERPKPVAERLPTTQALSGLLIKRPTTSSSDIGDGNRDRGGGSGSGGNAGNGGGEGGTVALRVLHRATGKPTKLEAAAVHVPMADSLARTVIRIDEEASEERQRLKRQILQAAQDHEAVPRGYTDKTRGGGSFHGMGGRPGGMSGGSWR